MQKISDISLDNLDSEKLNETPDFNNDTFKDNDIYNNLTSSDTKLKIYNLYSSHGIFLKLLDNKGQEKINKYNLSPIIEADTAGSAKKLSEENRNDVAVIASELAAEIYQLDILEKDFEDVKGNTTRFLIMSSNETKKINYDKNQKFITTCIFKLKSTPAALYNSLGGFASHSVNLTKLESFTVNNTFDQALFYLDIEGHDEEEGVKASLDILKKNTETLDILGVYQASDYRINH